MKRKILQCLAMLLALCLFSCACAQELDMLMVDRRLYELGYRDEACNGKLDEVTINALKSFQLVNDLEITGEPDDVTVNLLMNGTPKTEREYLSALAYKYSEITRLAKGSYGENVTRLQRALKKLGYFRSECDGAFGDATEAAVYRFQLANGIPETGAADGSTLMRLYEGQPLLWQDFINGSTASTGVSGDHVRRLQLRLKDMGYFTGKCTGRYGEATQQAVSHFQSMNDLSVTGEADSDTCKVIYSKAAVVLTDAQVLRRGSTGTAAEKLCARLRELGYPASETFNTRTEMALLKFQIANKLKATGALDSQTGGKLSASNTAAYDVEKWRGHRISIDDETKSQVAKAASARLGTIPEIESSFEFVQYMHLKCGVPLMEEAQLEMVLLDDPGRVTAGDTLLLGIARRSFYGVATGDGAVIYRSEEGYVVMSYLSMLNPREIYIWQKGADNGN